MRINEKRPPNQKIISNLNDQKIDGGSIYHSVAKIWTQTLVRMTIKNWNVANINEILVDTVDTRASKFIRFLLYSWAYERILSDQNSQRETRAFTYTNGMR